MMPWKMLGTLSACMTTCSITPTGCDKGRTMTYTPEQIKQIEAQYGDTNLYEAFWATPTCDCKTRPWEDTIGAYDYTD